MRSTQRALGTGVAVAVTMVVAALPMSAEADSGDRALRGPWSGSDQWTPFRYQDREITAHNWPGRWGGYRSRTILPPTIEPPVRDEPGYPTVPVPIVPVPTVPVPTVPVPTVPVPTVPAPTVPVPTVPATAEPTSPAPPTETAPVPTGSLEPVPPTPTSTATVEPTAPGTVKNRSGLSWTSGVYARGQGVAGVEAFAAWRKRPTDVVVDWPARSTWNDIVNPDWLYQTWQNTPYTKVFGVAPIPEDDSSATLAGCATGAYNEKWRQFGTKIKSYGLDDETVIRLGWEFNGNWYKWSASNPGEFAECWRQIVGTVEQVAPALRWDWNVNRGKGQSVGDARLAYPGDAYVDIVGVDSYDMWPGARDEAGWQQQYGGEYGLKFWADFAAAHGKKLSVAEWGNYPGPASAGQNGGDNPFYIAKMMAFFRSQDGRLAYEAYFNEDAAYFAGAIFAPSQVPAAAARYKEAVAP